MRFSIMKIASFVHLKIVTYHATRRPAVFFVYLGLVRSL